jgi:glutathione transport system permease protein
MFAYLVRRIAGTIPVLVAVSIFVFSFVHLLPGDPARLVAGPDAAPADVAAVRSQLGLDKPLWQQYLRFAAGAVQGDFGRSIKTKRTVGTEIGERFMPTLLLTLVAMVWSTLAGLVIGVWSAVRRGRLADHAGMVLAISGVSFPAFWLGLLLIDLFSVRLGWLPTGGYGSWQHFVLPSFTLGVAVAAVMARFTRSAFVEIAAEDYVRTARAKGVPERLVVWKHTLRNALIPVITMTGLQFGFLLGGSIVVETVFSWPGLGRLLIDSVSYRDYPVIQAEILLFSFEFVLINLLVDVLYAVVNPEIRLK